MAVGERLPAFAIGVAIDEMFFPLQDVAGLPSLAETMVSASKLNRSVPKVQAIVDKDAETSAVLGPDRVPEIN